MEERTLLILNGFYENHLGEKVELSRIIAVFEPLTGILKGIEIGNEDCDLNNHLSVLSYICSNCKHEKKFSLIAGYYDGIRLNYTNIFSDNKITFGKFDYHNQEHQLIGRERTSVFGRLTRDLTRKVNRYQGVILNASRKDYGCEFFEYCNQLYEAVEMVLLKANDALAWQGVQYSVEQMAPKKTQQAFVLTSNNGIHK